MPVRNVQHGALTIKDGTSPTPETLDIPLEIGDIQWTEEQPAAAILSRGQLAEWAVGEEVPCAIQFTVHFQEWRGKNASNNPSPRDALKGEGEASAWASTSSSGPFTTTLSFYLEDVEATGGQDETLVFTKFHADSIQFAEGNDSNKLTVSGRALVVGPTSTRT